MTKEIAAALAAVMATLDGVDQAVPGMNINPSGLSVDVYPDDPFVTDEGQGFGDTVGTLNYAIRARVATVDHDGAQDALMSVMDEAADALELDQTLNGLATSVDVDGPSGFRRYVDVNGETPRLGLEWSVKVMPAYS